VRDAEDIEGVSGREQDQAHCQQAPSAPGAPAVQPERPDDDGGEYEVAADVGGADDHHEVAAGPGGERVRDQQRRAERADREHADQPVEPDARPDARERRAQLQPDPEVGERIEGQPQAVGRRDAGAAVERAHCGSDQPAEAPGRHRRCQQPPLARAAGGPHGDHDGRRDQAAGQRRVGEQRLRGPVAEHTADADEVRPERGEHDDRGARRDAPHARRRARELGHQPVQSVSKRDHRPSIRPASSGL
jgi:hypothetical protein